MRSLQPSAAEEELGGLTGFPEAAMGRVGSGRVGRVGRKGSGRFGDGPAGDALSERICGRFEHANKIGRAHV